MAECLNKGDQCDVLAFDFSKGFNKVLYACLYQKLSHYGVHGPILSWLLAFLTDRTQYVILDNMKRYATSVRLGMPQWTVLAPLLFLMYINDLLTCVCNKAIKTLCWWCTKKLYSFINSKNDCISLQQDLTALEQWSLKWQMLFNYT